MTTQFAPNDAVRLRPMTEPEFSVYLGGLLPHYAADHVAAGTWTEAEALHEAEKQVRQLVPDGVKTKDHFIYTIVRRADETVVGTLWFARENRGAGHVAFIYDIEIDEQYRRLGYASQAFRLLEDEARDLGLPQIELHVFGDNQAARAMYKKLGYGETHVMMAKTLVSGGEGGIRTLEGAQTP
ncbi:MAG: GNAT family N-acetyltransferase [Chloroflexota bacterium]